jgi:hypothetical protein
MKSYYTNETLKSTAQGIKNDFEIGGASWEGVALEIARLQLSLKEFKKLGLDIDKGIDLGTWDGSYCASEKDITHYDPKCCTHDFESACACCLGDCDDCQDEQNIQLI